MQDTWFDHSNTIKPQKGVLLGQPEVYFNLKPAKKYEEWEDPDHLDKEEYYKDGKKL